jgi:hypothetical protein
MVGLAPVGSGIGRSTALWLADGHSAVCEPVSPFCRGWAKPRRYEAVQLPVNRPGKARDR